MVIDMWSFTLNESLKKCKCIRKSTFPQPVLTMKNIPEDCSKYLAPPNFLLNFSIDVAQKIPQGTIIDTDYPTVLRFELCVVSSETVAKKLSVFQKSLDWLPKISSIGGIALDDCSIFRLIKAYDG